MSSWGDLPNSLIGFGKDSSENEPESCNSTDFFLNFSEQKGVIENNFQNLSRTSAINNLLDNKKKEEVDREKNQKEMIIRNEKIIRTAQPPKKLKPRIGEQKIVSELYKAQKQTQSANDAVQDILKYRRIAPVARQILEWFLMGMDRKIREMEILKKFPDKEIVAEAITFMKKLANPNELLFHRLATFPALYDDNCEKCRKFLIDNHIQIRNVIPIEKCTDCKHKNALGTCSFFGAKIFCIWVDDEDCKDVINELFSNNKLTSSQCQALTEIPDATDRLIKAVRLAASSPGRQPDWTRPIRNQKTDSLSLSTANFDAREDAVKGVIGALSRGKTVTEINDFVANKYPEFIGIVNDAIARMKIISANSLDTCLSEKYVYSPRLELVKGEKCDTCQYASSVCCNKQDLKFTNTQMSLVGLNEKSPEAEEILSYFADCNFEISLNPPAQKSPLDIEVENLGKDLVVDVGKKSTLGQNIEIGGILNDTPELIFDVDPPQQYDTIDVSGLEEKEGFNLTNLL
jgi:hypothetical protein